MKAQIRLLLEKYDALSLRERGMVAGLIAVMIFISWNEFIWQSQGKRIKQVRDELSVLRTQIQADGQQIAALMIASRADPDISIKQSLQALQQQRDRLDKLMQEKMHGLIAPSQMAQVLEAVLTRQTDLKLQRIRNLPILPLLPSAQEGQSAQQPDATQQDLGIYRHGLQIEFSGSYLSALEYLKALDALPWDFYWDELALDVQDYPVSHITIKVHTLSLREGWIGV